MKIIYVGLRHEQYDPARRLSFEYENFYSTLKAMSSVTVIEYPYDRILAIGKRRFNEELVALARDERPDLFFAFMYTDELDPAALLEIAHDGRTKTLGWFADDYWRFWNYSRHWPKYFTNVVTTYSRAVQWYRRAGYENAIHSQWALNAALYGPRDLEKDIEVSFVGQYKPPRGRVIEALREAGVPVRAFGFGWPDGKISQDEMLNVFSRSKITLNLNVRPGLFSPRVLARLFFKKSMNHLVPDLHFVDNLRAYLHFPIVHTHARPFELAGCRAFVISGLSEDIGACYREDKEMVFYRSIPELLEKIKYYLAHNAEREAIAQAGYERTMREHTYERRFRDLFLAIGLWPV